MSKSSTSSHMTIFTWLGLAFVVLKLCGVIAWSWWWVTLPFWGGLAVALGLLFFVFVAVGVVNVLTRFGILR